LDLKSAKEQHVAYGTWVVQHCHRRQLAFSVSSLDLCTRVQ